MTHESLLKLGIPDWNAIQSAEIAQLSALGERIGYGRCIQILQQLWSRKLQADPRWPLDKMTADMSAGAICVWCETDTRTGEKIKAVKRSTEGKAL